MLDLSPGGAIDAAIFGTATLLAVVPIRSPRRAGLACWAVTAPICELPHLFLVLVAVSNVPPAVAGIAWPGGWSLLATTVATTTGLAVVARRAGMARVPLEHALDDLVGPDWRRSTLHGELPGRRRWWILLRPWPVRPRAIERVRDIAYADGGRATTLDLYRHRSAPDRAPAFIHLHGGGFRWGRKSRDARLLLHRLAAEGWIVLSANYTLSTTPSAGFPRHLVDVKRLLAWAHEAGPRHGIDPERIVLSGSSAGAHLTAMAAVTAQDPTYQPGFEGSDTTFIAAVGFYGYYGELGGTAGAESAPLGHDPSGSPPFLLVHGTNDTFTPIEGARALADHLRSSADVRVALAELPGAQHSFDRFRSVRYQCVVDAVAVFASMEAVSVVGDVSDRAGRPAGTPPCAAPRAH